MKAAALAWARVSTPSSRAAFSISASATWRTSHARLEATHAGQPAVVVGALGAEELEHLGVREDEEAAVAQAVDDRARDVLGLEHRRRRDDDAEADALLAPEPALQHRGVDAHRAQAADADAAVAVGDREPLGERHRRVLRHRVGRRAYLRREPGRRRRGQEVPAAALEPKRPVWAAW